MKIAFNKNQCPIWPQGINQRLFFINSLIHTYKINPEIIFNDRQNQNRFYDLFEVCVPNEYSKKNSILVNDKNTVSLVNEDIFWKIDDAKNYVAFDVAGDHEYNKKNFFRQTFKLSKQLINEAEKIYENIGKPTVAILIRETEKFDSRENIISAISSRIIYDKLVNLKLDKEKILIISDSFLTIDFLLQKGIDVVYYSKYKSKTIFPSHWFSKISRWYSDNSKEYELFDNVEYEMAYDYLLEVAMLTHCSIKNKYSTILAGPVILGNMLAGDNSILDLINFKEDLTDRELDMIKYHQSRECILWKTLFSYAEKNGEYLY